MVWWEGCVKGMVELMDLEWGREVHSGWDLNEEPMEENDVDD